MHIRDIQAETPYQDLLSRLRDPRPERREPNDPRIPIRELLNRLRTRYIRSAADFFLSPQRKPAVIAELSADMELHRDAGTYTTRNPRRAARLVVSDTLRAASAAGIANSPSEDLIAADSTFLSMLQWLLQMEGRPMIERHAFIDRFEMEESRFSWMEIGGPVWGSFLSELNIGRRGLRAKDRLIWAQQLHAALDHLPEIDLAWVIQFGREGANRLAEFEGSSRPKR